MDNSDEGLEDKAQRVYKTLGKAAHLVSWILFVLVVAIIGGVLLKASVTSTSGERIDGISPVVVVSGSMTPEIPVYSICLIKGVDISQVSEGDIVVYWDKHKKANIIHRVIGVDDRYSEKAFIVKGDANQSEDITRVQDDNLVGKVVLELPWTAKIMQKIINLDLSINYVNLTIFAISLMTAFWAIIYTLSWLVKQIIWRVVIRVIYNKNKKEGIC